jgi:phosphoglucomutase/phosphomannomutase
MADLVDQVTAIRHLPWAEAVRSGRIHFLDDSTHAAYVDLCRRQSLVSPPRGDELTVVFTPLHGVGAMTAMEVLVGQGFRVLPVAEQMTPDGQFPNVTQTPNPEVPASLDRAEALARSVRADLVLGTDPDADRLGAVAAVRSGHKGAAEGPDWPLEFLSGNSIAALLTHFKLERLAEQGLMPPSPIVVKTLVTTGLVTRIARHFGAQVVENLLVGFKYIAEVLWRLEQDGAYEDVRGTPEDFVIACEESHGILVTPHIRDKDAGASALLLAELALDQKRRGRSVTDYLQQLERRHGYFRTDLRTIVMTGIEGRQQMARMLDALRRSPPRELAGLAMTGFDDLRSESSWLGPLKGATDAAARNFLLFRFGDRARLALRPSGTEPKAKAYVEVVSAPYTPGTPAEQWQRTRRETDELARRLSEEFLRSALATVGLKPT